MCMWEGGGGGEESSLFLLQSFKAHSTLSIHISICIPNNRQTSQCDSKYNKLMPERSLYEIDMCTRNEYNINLSLV